MIGFERDLPVVVVLPATTPTEYQPQHVEYRDQSHGDVVLSMTNERDD